MFAAVHIPEFPVAAWLRAEPELRVEALAVLDGEPPLERVVSFQGACLARGMSRVQAGIVGPVRFRRRALAEEESALAALLAVAGRFSPRVEAVAGPANAYGDSRELAASLLVDRSGTEALLGPARAYAGKLAAELLASGFHAQVAAAPNAEASLMLARSCPGVTCVEGAQLAATLAGLPITALPCDVETLATITTMTRWGIRTLGELARLPEATLVSRLGQGARRLQRLALGVEESFLVPEEEAFTLLEQIALDTPMALLDSLLFVVSPMLDRILRRAVERACALRSVTLTLSLVKRGSHAIKVRPVSPSQSREQLLKLLHLQLQAHPPQAAIVTLALAAEPALPQTAQRGLFQAQFPDADKLDLLLARLKSIAGEHCVGSPQLVNSHREDLFRMAAFAPRSASWSRGPERTALALRRASPPDPVRVQVQGGAPRRVFFQGVQMEIAAAAGPWQSSGSWWDEHGWQAEEWDVAVREPVRALRLRHEPGRKAWFVAGTYD